jgi:hypothetical protein
MVDFPKGVLRSYHLEQRTKARMGEINTNQADNRPGISGDGRFLCIFAFVNGVTKSRRNNV